MSLRPPQETDGDYVTRSTHQVENPEGYEDWRSYAFSNAPELTDDLDVKTPLAGVPTV